MSIRTVRGSVDEESIGFTLMHEHLFMLSVGMYERWPHLLNREAAIADVAAKVSRAKRLGVQTIVDMTTPNMGRDLSLLAEVARLTGVNIVAATGAHPHEPLPLYLKGVVGDAADGIDPDRLADLFVHDLQVGMDGTNVKAGIIKTGSDPVVDDNNTRLLLAAARAHLRTGAPISTHTHAGNQVGLQQQTVFADAGVDLRHVIIGHCGDSIDLNYLTALADRGSFLGMDRFGYTMPGRPALTISQRVGVVAELCRRGYAPKMVLSSDSVSWSDVISDGYFTAHLPDWNLSYVASTVIDHLKNAGVSEDDLHRMTHVNPALVLSGGRGES
ncbi:phosphotriesterase-related protein [Arthrobacter sp. S39]|uniref:phosphotriesterase family protein n=1 Tax=Arthrobacter sp. S39 TaxID=2509720 RepID=UPI0013EF9090|nr:phosphotriesterase-related protein [Arthrobacter sp. S39]